jgi:hypothetical protein
VTHLALALALASSLVLGAVLRFVRTRFLASISLTISTIVPRALSVAMSKTIAAS